MLFALLGRLRWTPDAVWRATPREVAAALGSPRMPRAGMSRTELDALLGRFPDLLA